MGDRLAELKRERYGSPPFGEGTEATTREQGEGAEIARRRRVLWLGMNREDGEK